MNYEFIAEMRIFQQPDRLQSKNILQNLKSKMILALGGALKCPSDRIPR